MVFLLLLATVPGTFQCTHRDTRMGMDQCMQLLLMLKIINFTQLWQLWQCKCTNTGLALQHSSLKITPLLIHCLYCGQFIFHTINIDVLGL